MCVFVLLPVALVWSVWDLFFCAPCIVILPHGRGKWVGSLRPFFKFICVVAPFCSVTILLLDLHRHIQLWYNYNIDMYTSLTVYKYMYYMELEYQPHMLNPPMRVEHLRSISPHALWVRQLEWGIPNGKKLMAFPTFLFRELSAIFDVRSDMLMSQLHLLDQSAGGRRTLTLGPGLTSWVGKSWGYPHSWMVYGGKCLLKWMI